MDWTPLGRLALLAVFAPWLRRWRSRGIAAPLGLTLLIAAAPAWSASTHPSDLTPSRDTTPILTLQQAGATVPISRADIETLPLHTVEMTHFEGMDGAFTGVWLDALLAAHGLDDAPRLRITAHDDYSVFLTPAHRAAKRYLLTTRLDGEPLSLDTYGPTLLIVPADAAAILDGGASVTRWIWSIKRIAAP